MKPFFLFLIIVTACTNIVSESDQLTIQIDAYIVEYTSTNLNSNRDNNNINEVFNKVNEIWSQADITTEITIKTITIDDDSIDIERLFAEVLSNYDENKINAYFVQSLNGPNGIAFPGNTIMIADQTSVFDYRATSHEIGHVLGLVHVDPVNRLMARGVNGLKLTEGEINIARNSVNFN